MGGFRFDASLGSRVRRRVHLSVGAVSCFPIHEIET